MTPIPAVEPPPPAEGPDVAASPAACDWRFVLPIDERARVLDLTDDDAVALAVAGDAGEVVAVRTPAAAARLADLARAAGRRGLRVEVAASGALPAPGAPFDVILLHDARERNGPGSPGAVVPWLRDLRARVVRGGVLWVAGSQHGPGPAAWERWLARAGFEIQGRVALLPDVRRPSGILPLDREVARALSARIPGPPPPPLVRMVAKAARPLDLARRLVPAFGLVAHAAGGPR